MADTTNKTKEKGANLAEAALYYFQQEKLARLERLFVDIEKARYSEELLNECPELAAAVTEVEKTKYRIGIMKRHIEELGGSSKKSTSAQNGAPTNAKGDNDCTKDFKTEDFWPKSLSTKIMTSAKEAKPTVKYVTVLNYGDSIIERLTSVFGKTIKEVYPNIDVEMNLRETAQLKFGDYQFDCNIIAKRLGDVGPKVKPIDVAKKIAENLPKIDLVEKYVPVNAFVNVFLDNGLVGRKVATAFKNGITLPKIEKKKVVIDFSSPNIAKQMHVGHLRSTIIGESFSRLLEYAGFEVSRVNHIGDWGTQFGMLIAHLKDKFPNYATEAPPISDLQAFYKESKVRFDNEEEFKKDAYSCVVKLQSREPEITKAWKLICDISRNDYNQIYERLDIHITERGESFYQDRMMMRVANCSGPTGANIPLIIVKSDGGYTYDTSDMATIQYRLFEERGDWLLYVVDAGQAEHFNTIYAGARDLGWYKPEEKRVEHVMFGVVLGEDKKKFKTRSGDTVRLIDLLNEGVNRARQKLIEKNRNDAMTPEELAKAEEAVAYGCIKFADLSQSRTSDYMLNDQGKTAVYLLYAYARIKSIGRNAKISREQILDYVNNELTDLTLPLKHEAELKLAKQLLRFSDVILAVLETLHLHKLCDYVYQVAVVFHEFYRNCYVVEIDKETGATTTNYHRLVLCELAADTMKKCFEILGIRPLDIM
ncbi:putative arginine--tRNA ligase, cytoplasmic [Aphelenchoides bicaudatus]|nr:putative arginine--tRNA ligase, cytoplasmic [Aphelenchoides bicaudatus]